MSHHLAIFGHSQRELCATVGSSPLTIRNAIFRLRHYGQVTRQEGGRYVIVTPPGLSLGVADDAPPYALVQSVFSSGAQTISNGASAQVVGLHMT